MDFHKDFHQDHFSLFGLPRTYALDRSELERRYHEVQVQVHPDKHSQDSETERRLAMQWATRANEAYKTLRQPLARARYLLQLAEVDLDRSGALSTEFLVQQLEWREAVAEARNAADVTELEQLQRRCKAEMDEQYQKLAVDLDAGAAIDYTRVGDRVRRLMFQEKLSSDIDDALTSVDA
jgi:molecular chaperone HscB